MANIGRKLGVNIFTLMQNSGISREDLAVKLNYTYRDMCRILEGRVMLSPVEIEKIAGALGKTKKELLQKVYNLLQPGGYLFIGMTESINREAVPFQAVEPSVFRKPL